MPEYIEIHFIAAVPESDVKSIVTSLAKALKEYIEKNPSFSYRVGNDGLSIYTKYPDKSEELLYQFIKNDGGTISGIKLLNHESATELLGAVKSPKEFSTQMDELKKSFYHLKEPSAEPLNMFDPVPNDDFIKLYDEVHGIVEAAYKKAQLEKKSFGMVLLDNHENIFPSDSVMYDLTKQKDHNLYGIVQIMALHAYKDISGNKSCPLLEEFSEALIKKAEIAYNKRTLNPDFHRAAVEGFARSIGYRITSIDDFVNNNPDIEPTGDYNITKKRDDGMKIHFNSQTGDFCGTVGMDHAVGLQGMDYETLKKSENQNLKPDPSKNICSNTHYVLYLLPAEPAEFEKNLNGEKGIVNYVVNNSVQPETCKNWFLKNYSQKDLYYLTNRAIQYRELKTAAGEEKSVFSQIAHLASANLQQHDEIISADLTKIADILSPEGVQIGSEEYKAMLKKLVTDYENAAERYGFNKNSKIIKDVTDKIRSL